MIDLDKKYEYRFTLHLRSNKAINILWLSDNQYIDEVFEEIIKDKNYQAINIVKKNKLVPGYINVFDIEYIDITC